MFAEMGVIWKWVSTFAQPRICEIVETTDEEHKQSLKGKKISNMY